MYMYILVICFLYYNNIPGDTSVGPTLVQYHDIGKVCIRWQVPAGMTFSMFKILINITMLYSTNYCTCIVGTK